jgi:hypothetical protein
MSPQLQQVAQTYLTRRSLWVVGAFALLAFAISLTFSLLEPNDPIGALPILGVAAAVTGYALGIHAKSQFGNPRARLVPGFNRPHVVMLAAILIAWCGVCPLVVALAARWSLLGAFAFSIAGTAAGIWAMHRPHAITISLAFMIFLSFGTRPTIDFWVRAASTPAVAAARLAILAIGWGSIAYWFHRLRVLGEEDADYRAPNLTQHGPSTRFAGPQASCAGGRSPVPGSWQSPFADAFQRPASYVTATSIAQRQRLLRDGLLAKPLGARAAGIAAIGLGILAINALLGLVFSVGAGLDLRDNTPMLGVMIFMTSAMGNGQLAVRRPRMSQELMLPLRRQDYFHALFASSALNALMIWIITQAAIVAYVALFMPDYFFPAFLAAITALSLGFHLCMFGVQTSIARKNSSMFHFVAFMIILIPAATPVFIGLQHLPTPVSHLPQPVPTAAEREQLEQRVQQKYAERFADIDAYLQPETRQSLLDLMRKRRAPHVDVRPTRTYLAWICAAVLTATGFAAFLDARRRWLRLELG